MSDGVDCEYHGAAGVSCLECERGKHNAASVRIAALEADLRGALADRQAAWTENAQLRADLARVTGERDAALYSAESSDGAFRLAVVRADSMECQAAAARRDLEEALNLMESISCHTIPGDPSQPCRACLLLQKHGRGPLAAHPAPEPKEPTT